MQYKPKHIDQKTGETVVDGGLVHGDIIRTDEELSRIHGYARTICYFLPTKVLQNSILTKATCGFSAFT